MHDKSFNPQKTPQLIAKIMRTKITPIPAYNDNYIWLLHNGTHAVVVDPGLAEPVEKYLTANQLQLTDILITHHHWDHVTGIEALQTKWSCNVYAPDDNRIPGQLTLVDENDVVDLVELNMKLNIIKTPGHTLTHICYFDDQCLFCGDTLFSIGCGRMFEGTPEQYVASLNKLQQLASATQIYCTHEYTLSNLEFALSIEPHNEDLLALKASTLKKRQANQASLPTTMKREMNLNPFLRTNDTQLQNTLTELTGANINDNVTCFATLRQLKDNF